MPFVHAGQPPLAERGRWADARVAGNTGLTQGMHVRAVLVGLEQHPLTATAAVVWNGDLPRPLQQVLFDAADGITPSAPARTGEHQPAAIGL